MTWVDVNIPVGPTWDAENDCSELDSMYARELIKPGVLMELSDGSKLLVGHINKASGRCDCCAKDREAIVRRYAVIYEENA